MFTVIPGQSDVRPLYMDFQATTPMVSINKKSYLVVYNTVIDSTVIHNGDVISVAQASSLTKI